MIEDARANFSKELSIKKLDKIDTTSFDTRVEHQFINQCLHKIHQIKYGNGSSARNALDRILAHGNRALNIGSVNSSTFPS